MTFEQSLTLHDNDFMVNKRKKNDAKIAVLLATYNGAKFLPEFLDSLVSQSAKNFVVYVRDDGSSDCTLDVVRSYAATLDIVVLQSEKRLGPAHSFLELLGAAGEDCEYFAFADQDDSWHERKLERAVQALGQRCENPSLYFARVEYVNERLEYLGLSPVHRHVGYENALVENIAMGCTVMMNRAARALVVRTPAKSVTMHDWWVYLLISAAGRTIADDFVALKYRQHANNVVGASASLVREYVQKIFQFVRRGRDSVGLMDQASELTILYGDILSPRQRALVDMMRHGKSSFMYRLQLCLFSPFVRQRAADTLILRVLFLLNRY
jgi:glycosyltransferase involved in cell wall biosynthesis